MTIAPVPVSRLKEAADLAMRAWDCPGDAGELARELRGAIVLGAFDGGRLVGVVTAVLLGDHAARSDETAVSNEAQGKGVGEALWEALQERLRDLGVREVYGESSADRRDALRFFRRLGFEVVHVEISRGKPWFRDGTVVLLTRLRLGELGRNPVTDFTGEASRPRLD